MKLLLSLHSSCLGLQDEALKPFLLVKRAKGSFADIFWLSRSRRSLKLRDCYGCMSLHRYNLVGIQEERDVAGEAER